MMAKYAKYNLRSWAHFFAAIIGGAKKHDLRNTDDRDYVIGDILNLQEYDNVNGVYTGREQWVRVTYITSRNTPCAFSSAVLDNGYAILSYDLVGSVRV